jgi:DNA-binding NarL/FixJ family response regulator
MPPVRVLVVDDFDPFKELVREILEVRSDIHIIGQASDGLEAVQRAHELQPDLVLLDIGLPNLNGIEAARRIRLVSPHSVIIFVSQENSPDVIEECLRLGASAYVKKTDIHSKLVAALDAVLNGKPFLAVAIF